MPHDDESVDWQPMSAMPLVAGLIDGALEDTRSHLGTLTEARAKPHVLDDATLDRVERVHREQLDFVAVYAEQLRRWRGEGSSAAQARGLDRLAARNESLRAATAEVLALAAELRRGTIDRVMGMGDLELGLRALLGGRPPGRR